MRLARYAEAWDALVTRVNTPRMQTILGGATRVYAGEPPDTPEGPEGGQWGRLVIRPTTTLWEVSGPENKTQRFGVLFRAEFSPYKTNGGYRVEVSLEAAMDEVQRQVDGWVLPAMTHIRGVFPFFVYKKPDPMPVWDETRGLYLMSTAYRGEVDNPLGVVPFTATASVGFDAITPDVIIVPNLIMASPTPNQGVTHTQAVPATTWLIVHNLGHFPDVTVLDTTGTRVFGQEVHQDVNVLELRFSAPFSGVAYLD